jgi:hypothetical protein
MMCEICHTLMRPPIWQSVTLRLTIHVLYTHFCVISSEKHKELYFTPGITPDYIAILVSMTKQTNKQTNKQTPWSESVSELCRPSDRRLSAKWLPTFADRGCHVVSVTDPYGHIFRFSRQEPLLFYQVAPQLYSRGWLEQNKVTKHRHATPNVKGLFMSTYHTWTMFHAKFMHTCRWSTWERRLDVL